LRSANKDAAAFVEAAATEEVSAAPYAKTPVVAEVIAGMIPAIAVLNNVKPTNPAEPIVPAATLKAPKDNVMSFNGLRSPTIEAEALEIPATREVPKEIVKDAAPATATRIDDASPNMTDLTLSKAKSRMVKRLVAVLEAATLAAYAVIAILIRFIGLSADITETAIALIEATIDVAVAAARDNICWPVAIKEGIREYKARPSNNEEEAKIENTEPNNFIGANAATINNEIYFIGLSNKIIAEISGENTGARSIKAPESAVTAATAAKAQVTKSLVLSGTFNMLRDS
jgi:hypothetical protein